MARVSISQLINPINMGFLEPEVTREAESGSPATNASFK